MSAGFSRKKVPNEFLAELRNTKHKIGVKKDAEAFRVIAQYLKENPVQFKILPERTKRKRSKMVTNFGVFEL